MTQQSDYEATVETKAQHIFTTLTQSAIELQSEFGHDVGSAQRVLMAAVRALVDERAGSGNDSRACLWRVRLRLYDNDSVSDDPIADTDAERDPRMPGETVLLSLPAVAGWVAEMAASYHSAPCAGLDSNTLKRKLQSLRTQLSQKRDGTACWRIPYSVVHANAILTRQLQCIARVDIVRETTRA